MKRLILLTLLGLLAISCGSPTPNPDPDKIQIAVSILPQKYFVQRIIGDSTRFDIQVMIPPKHSPETYSPTPRQMQSLSRCSLYFRIGHIPFETAWMNNIAANNPNMKIVDTSTGVDLIQGDPEEKEDADEKESHRHHHSGIDPHIWLSPKAVKIQARHILNAIIEIDPQGQKTYKENYEKFLRDIDQLDQDTKALLEKCPGKQFMVFHPAWSYFAREYGLTQIPIEIEGKDPSPAEMKKIIDTAKHENLRAIFIQEQFDTHSAQSVAAEINGQVIKLDPLAEDWLTSMKQTAQMLSQALGSNPVGDNNSTTEGKQ